MDIALFYTHIYQKPWHTVSVHMKVHIMHLLSQTGSFRAGVSLNIHSFIQTGRYGGFLPCNILIHIHKGVRTTCLLTDLWTLIIQCYNKSFNGTQWSMVFCGRFGGGGYCSTAIHSSSNN